MARYPGKKYIPHRKQRADPMSRADRSDLFIDKKYRSIFVADVKNRSEVSMNKSDRSALLMGSALCFLCGIYFYPDIAP